MVTVADCPLATVLTVKVFDVVPAATTTLAGTDTSAGLELVSSTAAPPAGAGALSRTVPMTELPALTRVELSESEARVVEAAAGLTVNVVVLVAPP